MKKLAIGPAAMGIYAQIGWLKKHEARLQEVDEISGSSAGAVLAVLLGMGISPDRMMEVAMDMNISDLVKVSIRSFVNKFGFVDTGPLRAELVRVMGCSPTFAELKIKIHIAAYCLNTGKTIYFSRDTHPDMPVIDAVCMSFAIPILFSAVEYQGHFYVDGGTRECVPIGPFLGCKPHEVTSISIKNTPVYHTEIKNHIQFAEALIRSALENRTNHCTPDMQQVIIDVGDVNVFDFQMDYETKLSLAMKGHE